MSTKERYRDFCRTEPTIPIFARDWWLDATAGSESWEVVLVEKGGHIFASLPFTIRYRNRFKILSQPPLTQALGPWLRPCPNSMKYANWLGQQKSLMEALIEQLPSYDHFRQNWHTSQSNWLPFYWHGFKQTTRYTYLLPDLSDTDAIWSDLRSNIRGDVRKAANRYGLRVRDDLKLDDFIQLNRAVFSRQGMDAPISEHLIRRIDAACEAKGCRKYWIAVDSEGQQHAGVYIVWDQERAYYLLGGADPQLRNSGAASLCLWEAVHFAAGVSKSFDFEGSMIEPIERFFRSFGGIQTPYFNVTSTPSWVIRAWQALQGVRGIDVK